MITRVKKNRPSWQGRFQSLPPLRDHSKVIRENDTVVIDELGRNQSQKEGANLEGSEEQLSQTTGLQSTMPAKAQHKIDEGSQQSPP